MKRNENLTEGYFFVLLQNVRVLLEEYFWIRMFCEYVVKKKTYCNDSCEEREKIPGSFNTCMKNV